MSKVCNVTLAERVIALQEARLPGNAYRAALIALMEDMTAHITPEPPVYVWDGVFRPRWIMLAQAGRKIDAIKEVRNYLSNKHGQPFGLRDSKDIVEMFFPIGE